MLPCWRTCWTATRNRSLMTDEAHEDIFLTALILSNSLERKQRSCGTICWTATGCMLPITSDTYRCEFCRLCNILWRRHLSGKKRGKRMSVHNIIDYGASTERKITRRLSSGRSTRPAREGGGTVSVPAGEYLCGHIELKSHVNLHLDQGRC